MPYRETPEGVRLADPAFEPLPGARADFGRLGGAVYQIEIPEEWNGGLVMWMHWFGGFSTGEQEAAFQALLDWVERGVKPDGTNLDVDDLTSLDQTFEDTPRDVTTGTDAQVTLRGRATLDGEPLHARWMGAVVRRNGLVTPCNVSLPPSVNGHYEIGVYTDDASARCGRPGSEVLLWTYVADSKLYATETIPWPAMTRGPSTSSSR